MRIKLFESEEKAFEIVPQGSIRKLTVKGTEYVVTHIASGLIVAEALCPHMKEPLYKGKLNAFNEIICPLHEYRFNLETGAESSNKCHDLRIFNVEVEHDGVFLHV